MKTTKEKAQRKLYTLYKHDVKLLKRLAKVLGTSESAAIRYAIWLSCLENGVLRGQAK